MLNGGRGLNGFDFQSGTDVGEGAGTEGKRLGMVSLPTLVLGTKIKGARVLQVGREDDGLVSSLPRKLHTEIPRVQRHEGKLQVLADEVFLSEGVETVDGIAESACRAHMFPGESSQARYGSEKRLGLAIGLTTPMYQNRQLTAERRDGGVDRFNEDALAVEL